MVTTVDAVSCSFQNLFYNNALVVYIGVENACLVLYSLLALTLIFIYFLYKEIFLKVFVVDEDCTELGFEETGNKGMVKRAMINEYRRRKKADNLPNPFPNGWFGIIESDQLSPGESKEIMIFGQSLVAWRGLSGECYVSDSICPHLGAHLGIGSRVVGDCIECPFHSWCFDGKENGKLIKVPYANKTPDGVNLKMWTSMELNGFLFIWYHVDNEPPSWYPPPIPGIMDNSLRLRSRMSLTASCLLQDISENGADFSHLNELHTDFSMLKGDLKGSKHLRKYARHVHEGGWVCGTEEDDKHTATLKGTQWIEFLGKYRSFETGLHSIYIGPGLVHIKMTTPFATFNLVQTAIPIDFNLVKFCVRAYTSKLVPSPMIKSFVDAFIIQIQRDIRIFNRKKYLDKPYLVAVDKKILAFRRWHNQFYSTKMDKDKDGPVNGRKDLDF